VSFVLSTDPRRTNEPWLVWDNRASLQARNDAGLHVLICGISDYPNLPGPGQPDKARGLGMRRLTATALSAYLMLDWVIRAHQSGQLAFPLATCRVLLSATPAEQAKAPPLGNTVQPYRPKMAQLGAPRCTLKSLQDAAVSWRTDAAQRRDAATLFYFAGHGIQRTRGDQILLLEDFASSSRLLEYAVDLSSLRDGMAPTRATQNIARTQFYFIDACRNLPPVVLSYQQLKAGYVFDVEESGLDDRRAPVFFAAPPDARAQAVPTDQTLFAAALLRCLSGEAAQPPRDDGNGREMTDWHVTSQSLNRGLKTVLDELNRTWNGVQSWIADGFGEDAVLCYLGRAPSVRVRIMVEPEPAVPATRVRVADSLKPATVLWSFPSGGSPHPYQQSLPAGQYDLEAIAPAPYTNQKRSCLIEPLGSRLWKLKVQP
jgi:Caspase domain